ncbi:hypothetical protein Tco_0324816 [Tanacetum coccineum]
MALTPVNTMENNIELLTGTPLKLQPLMEPRPYSSRSSQMSIHFAPSTRKGVGEFVVDDVLDIQTAVATHTTGTGTILATSSATTTKESASKDECPQGTVLDTSSTTTTGVVLATSPTGITGEPTNKDTEIPEHNNTQKSKFPFSFSMKMPFS